MNEKAQERRTTSKAPSGSYRLTPSEIAALRQDAKEADEYFKKRWAHLRPKA